MKAFALLSADQPASLVDLPDPEVGSDGVRVRIRAASVNGFDVFQASGYLAGMMEHRFPTVVGRDFAGIVEAVGPRPHGPRGGRRGARVRAATPPLHDGTYAELVAGAGLVLARKPAGLSFEVAAAIPLAGATALDAVDAVAIGPGDTVLVVGCHGRRRIDRRPAGRPARRHGHRDREGGRRGGVRPRARRDRDRRLPAVDVAETVRARFPDGVNALIDIVNRDKAACTLVSATVRAGGRVATTLGAADSRPSPARRARDERDRAPRPRSSRRSPHRSPPARCGPGPDVPARRASGRPRRVPGGKLGKLVIEIA